MIHMTDGSENKKPLMRALGEFVGHIWSGITHDPAKDGGRDRMVVDKEVREERRGKTVLRETVVREIEIADGDDEESPV